jgi:hypothetical protein
LRDVIEGDDSAGGINGADNISSTRGVGIGTGTALSLRQSSGWQIPISRGSAVKIGSERGGGGTFNVDFIVVDGGRCAVTGDDGATIGTGDT